jgi:hypothetical protein
MRLATRFIFAAVLALFVVGVSQAQGHTVTLTWSPSSDAAANPTLTYTVSRAAGVCSSSSVFTTIMAGIAVPSGATPGYVNTGVAPGTYCYQVSAQLNGASSGTTANPNPTVSAPVLPAVPGQIVIVIN